MEVILEHGIVPVLLICNDFVDWHGREVALNNPAAHLASPLGWLAQCITNYALPRLIHSLLTSSYASDIQKLKVIKHLLPPPDPYGDIVLENTRVMRQRMRFFFANMPHAALRSLDREILQLRRGETPFPSLSFSREIRARYPTGITVTRALQEVFRQNAIEWIKKKNPPKREYYTSMRAIITPGRQTRWVQERRETNQGYFNYLMTTYGN